MRDPNNDPKQEVITFKADPELALALADMSNRSQFIRDAIRAALQGACPLCNGSGTLTRSQRDHWQRFTFSHHVVTCEGCHEPMLVCDHEGAAQGNAHAHT